MSRHKAVPFLVGFPILFLLAIPWYWRFFPELSIRLVAGFPVWVLASIGFSALISTLVVIAVYALWPLDDDEGGGDADSQRKDDAEVLAS